MIAYEVIRSIHEDRQQLSLPRYACSFNAPSDLTSRLYQEIKK
jgi:hypothetical protein